jgi:hypothetical protein
MATFPVKTFVMLMAFAAGWFGLGGIADAAKPQAADRVDLFAAVKSQQVELKVVPKDASQATVMIKNKTDRPLSIKLPPAFAGVPVLAQNVGGGGNNRGNNNNSSSTSANQSFGGGFGGGGMGMMGGMGGGMFDVGPDRVGKIKVATVCLEHGKEDPNPRVAYELKPLEEFTDKPEVIEVCKMLGRGQLDQSTAQAAAWHLTDGLSWQQLAQKVRVKHLDGRLELYFSPGQLNLAMQAVQVAHHRTSQKGDQSPIKSPGEQADTESLRQTLSSN